MEQALVVVASVASVVALGIAVASFMVTLALQRRQLQLYRERLLVEGPAEQEYLAALLKVHQEDLVVVQAQVEITRNLVSRLPVPSDSQGWYWTEEWQEGEREADRDMAAGRTLSFESEAEMDEYLSKIPLPFAASGSGK